MKRTGFENCGRLGTLKLIAFGKWIDSWQFWLLLLLLLLLLLFLLKANQE